MRVCMCVCEQQTDRQDKRNKAYSLTHALHRTTIRPSTSSYFDDTNLFFSVVLMLNCDIRIPLITTQAKDTETLFIYYLLTSYYDPPLLLLLFRRGRRGTITSPPRSKKGRGRGGENGMFASDL